MRHLNTVCLLSMLAFAAVAVSARADAQGLFTKPQLGILGGVTLPTGELEEDAATGWHAGGFFKIRLRGALDARLDGAYNKFGSKHLEFADATLDLDANVVFGSLGMVLNLGPDSAAYPGDNSISPYIMAGVGAYRFTGEGICSGSGCLEANLEDRTSKAGFNLGAGANVPLWGIPAFAEFRYHRFGARLLRTGVDGTATMLTGSVGIRIR